MLTAFLLRRGDDPGWQMPEAYGALCLVDVLAARAARTKGINLAFAQQIFIGFRQNDDAS